MAATARELEGGAGGLAKGGEKGGEKCRGQGTTSFMHAS